MKARVWTININPDKVEEAQQIMQQELQEGAKHYKGLKHWFLLTSPNNTKTLSIAIWNSEEEMMAGDVLADNEAQNSRFKDITVGEPTPTVYDVAERV